MLSGFSKSYTHHESQSLNLPPSPTMGTIPDGADRKLERLPLVSWCQLLQSSLGGWTNVEAKSRSKVRHTWNQQSARVSWAYSLICNSVRRLTWKSRKHMLPGWLKQITIQVRWYTTYISYLWKPDGFSMFQQLKTPSETAWTVQLSLPKGRTCDWPAICAGMASMHHHMPCRLKGWKVHKIRKLIPNCVTDKGV